MDLRLQVLKRLSLTDPEMKERYISTLEQTVGGVAPSDPKSMVRGGVSFWIIRNQHQEGGSFRNRRMI